MPPLPATADAAAAAPPDTALAFAIEAARAQAERGAPPPGELRGLFTRNLALLIDAALAPGGGDPAFQALALRAGDPQVDAYARLAAQASADQRAVRAGVGAIAHPGRLQALSAGAQREALARLHRLAMAQSWPELAEAIGLLLRETPEPGLHAALQALAAGDALQRLLRADAALRQPGVQRYLALCALRGPLAGSSAAAAQGRAAARTGELAERATAQAFAALADLLNRHAGPGFRALRGLRTPPGFPGEAGKAKDEWDAALVREAGADGGADIVLLAEVKASPAAATPDFARLHRGLERLALAHAEAGYVFACDRGEVRLRGAALRALRPVGRALPPHVVYCSSAAPEAQPPMLSAASKAVLLAEPASLAWARQRLQGEAPPHAQLAPVWDALATEPRLRAALNQYATARAVREAMLHPDDLLAAAAQCLREETA